jgi:hypothetical protein
MRAPRGQQCFFMNSCDDRVGAMGIALRATDLYVQALEGIRSDTPNRKCTVM